MTLTARQSEVLEFIRGFIAEKKYPPTVREIAAKFDIASTEGVMCHLRALVSKGFIQHEPGLPRTIRIVEQEPC